MSGSDSEEELDDLEKPEEDDIDKQFKQTRTYIEPVDLDAAKKKYAMAEWIGKSFKTEFKLKRLVDDTIGKQGGAKQSTGGSPAPSKSAPASKAAAVNGQTYPFKLSREIGPQILARCKGRNLRILISEFDAEVSCDIPMSLWEAHGSSSAFSGKVVGTVALLTDHLIVQSAAVVDVWNEKASKLQGDEQRNCIVECNERLNALGDQWRSCAEKAIMEFFEAEGGLIKDYRKYQAKAGFKLALTSAGAIVSIAALSTAATPAAPATLVPALIGLVSAFGSIFKQIYDLDAEAETVARFIMTSVDALKVKWRDKEGAWNRKTFKAREVATAFSEAVSQGWSEFVVPSLGSVQSKCDLLRNKCKGLEVRAKKLGETFDEIMKALNSAELVIKHNYTFSIELGTQGFALQRNLEKLEEARRQSQQEFEKAFDVLAKLNGRISFAMAVYSAYKPRIDEAVEVLGTKDINKAVTVITQLGMIGVGLSSAPSIVAEDITYAMSAAASFTDLCREYGPEVIEKFKKKK